MKKALLILFLIGVGLNVSSQSWLNSTLNNEVRVSFPIQPEYRKVDNKEVYLCKTSSCAFMIGIAPKMIEDYQKYNELSESDQLKTADSILTNFIGGKIGIGNRRVDYIRTIKIGKFFGKECGYTTETNNQQSGKKRFSTLILVRDKLYTFECWYLDEKEHDAEKERFFSSIVIKNS